ncbi:ImmA/IrrE family metallo-endopeptidase [Candidatus Daviesbacteria bacterium]|nr:ImmA/IrrE family metallo-endopeptidase [Candidatus Daviesbacteria bacterium]
MQPPNITLSNVIRASEDFLEQFHSTLLLPIPIEEIVELKMGIALVVIPGIKDLIGVDSFISADFSQITVDEYSFTTYLERTRFSIAHEIGHYILHKDWYEQNGPKSIEDYLTFYDRIDSEVYKYLEIQAQTFAGLVLVPKEALLKELKNKMGYVPTQEALEIFAPVYQDLLNAFQVSGEVLLRRLQKDGIVKNNF